MCARYCALAIRQKMRRLQAIVLFAHHHHRYKTEHHCKYIREITIHKFSPFTEIAQENGKEQRKKNA